MILGNNEERIVKYFFDNNFEAFKKYAIETGFKDVVKNLEIEFRGAKILSCSQTKRLQRGNFKLVWAHSSDMERHKKNLIFPQFRSKTKPLYALRILKKSHVLHLHI